MNDDGVRMSQIDWRRVIPSLRLLDAISLAVSRRVLVPVCVLLMGLWLSDPLSAKFFSGIDDEQARPQILLSDTEFPEILDTVNRSLTALAAGNFSQCMVGFVTLAGWMLWLGCVGVAAMRSAGCVFCTGTGSGVVASTRYAAGMWKSIVLSTLLSWILLALPCLAFRFLSWAGTRTHEGIVAFGALLYVLGCVVLGVGWLLSLAAIAVDRCDGAEALSRGICYVLSRWLRVVMYALILSLMLVVSDLVVSWFNNNAYALAMTASRIPEENGVSGGSIRCALHFLSEAIRLSLFLSGIVGAYVLLRNVEDGVSLREIDGGSRELPQ